MALSPRSYPPIIAEALKNARTAQFLASVESALPEPVRFDDEGAPYWRSRMENGVATIGCGPTNHPAESLVHELLHIKLDMAGYRTYSHVTGLYTPEMLYPYNVMMQMLNNSLHHHRMFKTFEELGFDGRRFYREQDRDAVNNVQTNVDRLSQNDQVVYFAHELLVVIAPGGEADDEQRHESLEAIRRQCAPQDWLRLLEVHRLMLEWETQNNLDPCDTIRAIMAQLVDDAPVAICPENYTRFSELVMVTKSFTELELSEFKASNP